MSESMCLFDGFRTELIREAVGYNTICYFPCGDTVCTFNAHIDPYATAFTVTLFLKRQIRHRIFVH